MKLKRYLGFLLIAFLILSNVLSTTADTPAGSNLVLVSANSQEAVLELTVADFQTESIEHAGETYQRLVISGLEQTVTPGAPQVPLRGAMVGLSSTSGLSVEIVEADYETLTGYRLYPAPGLEPLGGDLQGYQEVFALDDKIYSANTFYPAQPVELGEVSMLRDQAAVPVRLYPIQYNPASGEIRFYRRLRVRVSWDDASGTTTAASRSATPAYENLLRRLLLNYEALTRPPAVQSASPPGVIKGAVGAAAGSDRVKIGVTEDGMYEVTPADLPVGFDINTLKLKNKGTELPIYVHDSNSNSAFDGGDYFLFYGVAITDNYTTKNVYWLEDGGGAGQRMNTRSSPPGGATVPNEFPTTLHIEKDSFNWLNMPNSEVEDSWFWGTRLGFQVSGLDSFRDFPMQLNNLSTTAGKTATIRVRMKGFTGGNHRTKIRINGLEVSDQDWGVAGQIIYDQEKSDLQNNLNLQNGSNTIQVRLQNYPGQQLFVNWIELDYWDKYVAENNQLLFGAPNAGTFKFNVSNFSSNDIQVFDVTNPSNVVLITNASIGGSFTVQFQDAAQTNTRYLAFTSAARKDPASIELDVPSSLQDPTNVADYIMITHQDFHTEAVTLANHRSAFSGLTVAIVKVEDIYDEFNYGIFNPQAIRDFLMYAYNNWNNGLFPPDYVLLLGGASYDYRGTLEPPLNRTNYVPTKIVDTDQLAQVPTDNWFVQTSDSNITPLMFIGRLPAQDSNEAAIMVNKIIDYDLNPPNPFWNTNALFVADNEPQFETFSQDLISRLPTGFTDNQVYLLSNPPPDPEDSIKTHINNGTLLVNYAGHGNVVSWSAPVIFGVSTISSLSNNNKLPVVTIGDCLNGYFVGQSTSIAEKFLQVNNKGAVAVWAATGLGLTSAHRPLISAFYDEIFTNGNLDLGTATTLAKISVYLPNPTSTKIKETVETFVLFGDPAMQLGVPDGLNEGITKVYLPVIIRDN